MANKVRVESVVYRGVKFYRYPDSKKRNHRVYYQGYVNGKLTYLHRYVWETRTGKKVPAGYDVHHKDDNPLNNRFSNLELLSRKDHLVEHAQRGAFSSEKQIKHLAAIRGKATAWHKSEEGRAWHREHAKTTLTKRKKVQVTCAECGKTVTRVGVGTNKYCSRLCGGRAWRKTRFTPVRTARCKNCDKEVQYQGYRYEVFCSARCSTYYAATRKD